MNGRRLMYSSFACLLLSVPIACNKEKVKDQLPYIPHQNFAQSSVRIINLSGVPCNLTLGNIPLTMYNSGASGEAPTQTQLAKNFFPSGLWEDGRVFPLPTFFFSRSGSTTVDILGNRNGLPLHAVDTLNNDPLHPKDYYFLANGKLAVLARSLETPSSPSNIKIRLVNLLSAKDTLLGLVGPATLTYANGRLVSPLVTNVGVNTTSSFAEVPFGAYEFKVFLGDSSTSQILTNRELTQAGLPYDPTYDPCNNPTVSPPQTAIFNAIQTFAPGGTYTVFISPVSFYYDCNGPVYEQINAYHVISENSIPPNTNYALFQSVNALFGRSVQFKIDGIPMDSFMHYGKYGLPKPLIVGQRKVEAVDDQSNVVAQANYNFYAYDDITAWIYKAGGAANIVFTNNDITSSLFIPNSQADGTDGGAYLYTPYYAGISFTMRFINLSDLPFATFTNSYHPFYRVPNGPVLDTISYVNLYPGKVPDHNPLLIFPFGGLHAQQSPPFYGGNNPIPIIYVSQTVPGFPAIKPLQPKSFVADSSIYVAGIVPAVEAGIYTVGLIGSVTDTAMGQRAKMIVVKHNQ